MHWTKILHPAHFLMDTSPLEKLFVWILTRFHQIKPWATSKMWPLTLLAHWLLGQVRNQNLNSLHLLPINFFAKCERTWARHSLGPSSILITCLTFSIGQTPNEWNNNLPLPVWVVNACMDIRPGMVIVWVCWKDFCLDSQTYISHVGSRAERSVESKENHLAEHYTFHTGTFISGQ